MKIVSVFVFMLLSACVTAPQYNNEFESQTPKKVESMRPTPSGTSPFLPRPQKRAVRLLLEKSADFLDHGRLDQAISSLERAYRIDYLDPHVSLLMARTLFAKGQDDQAEQWALKSINLWHRTQKQQKKRAWELISQCRLRQGDYEGANNAIGKARSI